MGSISMVTVGQTEHPGHGRPGCWSLLPPSDKSPQDLAFLICSLHVLIYRLDIISTPWTKSLIIQSELHFAEISGQYHAENNMNLLDPLE